MRQGVRATPSRRMVGTARRRFHDRRGRPRSGSVWGLIGWDDDPLGTLTRRESRGPEGRAPRERQAIDGREERCKDRTIAPAARPARTGCHGRRCCGYRRTRGCPRGRFPRRCGRDPLRRHNRRPIVFHRGRHLDQARAPAVALREERVRVGGFVADRRQQRGPVRQPARLADGTTTCPRDRRRR